MSFAEEFKTVTARGPKAPVAQTQPQAEGTIAEQTPQDDASAIMNNGMPDYNAIAGEAVPELPVGGKPEPEAPKAPAKFRIGDKEFATQDEAFEYANKIAIDKVQTDAFAEGQKATLDALTPKEEVKVKTLLDEVEEELFVNPKAALEKLQNGIAELIDKKAEERETKQRVEQQRKEATEKMYKDFYAENQDIADFPELVEFVTQKHWDEVGKMPVKQGLARVAEETRKMIKKSRESAAPQRELSSKPATVAGGGSTPAPIATSNSTPQSPLDFISQVNKHRKRT